MNISFIREILIIQLFRWYIGNNCKTQSIVTGLMDCSEVQGHGYDCTGIFTIQPSPSITVDVWCDLSTDGGRWTVTYPYFLVFFRIK